MRMTRLTGENIMETLLAGHPVPAYFPRVELGWVVAALLVVGVLVIGLSALSRKLTRAQGILVAFIAFIAAFSFSDVLGVDGSRTYRMLYIARPFFVLLPAVGIMILWTQARKFAHERVSLVFELAVIALIVGFSVSPLMAGLGQVASGNQAVGERWKALQWVRDNTPQDSRVFYLFGFEHEVGMLAERVPFKGDLGLGFTQRNIVELCSGKFPGNFSGQWGSAITVQFRDDKMWVPTHNGLFNVQLTPIRRPGTEVFIPKAEDEVPLSGFDYVVFQHQGTQADPCMAFFLNQSLSRGGKVAWKNNQFTVLEVAA
jgi:hypothetical protein